MNSDDNITWASGTQPQRSLALVRELQNKLHGEMAALDKPFTRITWKRDDGQHGGGDRLGAEEGGFFNRASINISQVQYEDDPGRPLESATALSAIVHPDDPRHPSLHLHISFTQRKGEEGTWRMMGDLNPSQPTKVGEGFRKALEEFNVEEGVDAFAQGDHYFWIPALERHRGVCHFYLESFSSESFDSDLQLADAFGQKVISTYSSLLQHTLNGEANAEEKKRQLEYHTLYFFQVLLLDRGTTAGILVHDQNDVGILGSLPSKVDTTLLKSWSSKLPELQSQLLEGLIMNLKDSVVTGAVKKVLAKELRGFYRKFPEALQLQAQAFNPNSQSSPHLPSLGEFKEVAGS